MERPLELKVDPIGWYLFSLRKADPAFRKYQNKILERDSNTCQFCTFQGSKYFEVINIDGNYNNNKMSNMVSACCFCTQCLFLDSAGIGEYGGGMLIYAPKISQKKLNSLCHVLFCVMANNTGYKISAKTVYRNLKFGAKAVEKKFGIGASVPTTFAKLLMESNLSSEEIQNEILKDLRLLPSRKKFAKQIRFWADEALENLAEESEIDDMDKEVQQDSGVDDENSQEGSAEDNLEEEADK